LEVDFFLKLVEFAKTTYQVVQNQKLPPFNHTQIGVTESGEFVLCDPAFFFSGHSSESIEEGFESWIKTFVRDVLNLPLDQQ